MSIEIILYELYERHTLKTGKYCWGICVSVKATSGYSGLKKDIPPPFYLCAKLCISQYNGCPPFDEGKNHGYYYNFLLINGQ